MNPTREKKARNDRIVELRRSGLSFIQIAFKLVDEGFEQISPQRISEIYKARTTIAPRESEPHRFSS